MTTKINNTNPHPVLLGVGRLSVTSDWHAKKHAHSVVQMMVILRGHLLVRIGQKTVAAKTGDILYYPPNVPHIEKGTGPLPLEFIYFLIKPALPHQSYVAHDVSGKIRILAQWLYDEQQSDYDHKNNVMNAILNTLLAELHKISNRLTDKRVHAVRAFIDEHLQESLSVTDLSSQINMSRAHFIRTYKHLTGRTPMAELRIRRVEKARTLLITTDRPLKTIATEVGFSDEYQLSRVFCRYLHVPPGYFRK